MKIYISLEVVFMKGCCPFMKRHEYLYKYVAWWRVNGNAFEGHNQEIMLTLQSLQFLSCFGHLGSYLREHNTQIGEVSLYPKDLFWQPCCTRGRTKSLGKAYLHLPRNLG